MRRTSKRLKEEYELNKGEQMSVSLSRLRETVRRRDKRVEDLLQRIKDLKEQHSKEIHQLGILHRREIRKSETRERNQKKKVQEWKKRNKIKRVKTRVRWKTYEPSEEIRKLEESVEKASKVSRRVKDFFEMSQKVDFFIDNKNKENGSDLTRESLIILMTLEFIDDVRGVPATRPLLYNTSPYKLRENMNMLVREGYLVKDSIWYRISFSGKELIKDAINYISYGSSEIIKVIKHEEDKGT